MKTLTALFITLCMFATSASAQLNGYFNVGASWFQEETDSLVGSGISPRLGVGTQINDALGLELNWDTAPALDTDKVINEFRTEGFDASVFDIDTKGNRYLSFLGTARLEMSESTHLVGKIGVASYLAEVSVSIDGVSIDAKEEGTAGMMSVGVLFNAQAKHCFELSLSKVFDDDVGTFFSSGVYRFRF